MNKDIDKERIIWLYGFLSPNQTLAIKYLLASVAFGNRYCFFMSLRIVRAFYWVLGQTCVCLNSDYYWTLHPLKSPHHHERNYARMAIIWSQGLIQSMCGGTCGGEQGPQSSPLGWTKRPVGLRGRLASILTHGGAALSIQLVWRYSHMGGRWLRQGVSVVAKVRWQVTAGSQSHFSGLETTKTPTL